MRYKDIILQAYTLTVRNPLYWLFGLVLFGGFNLYLINFFSLLRAGEWKIWPLELGLTLGSPSGGYFTTVLAIAALFVVINLIKIIFIVVIHNKLHNTQDLTCDLCAKTENESLPYFIWLGRVMLASGLTIAVTSGIALATNALVSNQADNPAAIITNLIFITIVSCIAGAWNLFTGYFIVLHGLKFSDAASSAIDLLVNRARRVVEFLVILSVLYTVSVFIGSAFIEVWHQGFEGMDATQIRVIALIIFVVWFAVNNVFFNVALLIFFDKLVKAIGTRKTAPDGQLQPNIVN